MNCLKSVCPDVSQKHSLVFLYVRKSTSTPIVVLVICFVF